MNNSYSPQVPELSELVPESTSTGSTGSADSPTLSSNTTVTKLDFDKEDNPLHKRHSIAVDMGETLVEGKLPDGKAVQVPRQCLMSCLCITFKLRLCLPLH